MVYSIGKVLYCSVFSLIPMFCLAQQTKPPFDIRIAITQSMQASHSPASRNSEFLIDTSAVFCPITGIQTYPAVAYDGNIYLVVWQDRRSDLDYDIFCARVDQSGFVFDPVGIAIATAGGDQKYPAVAFNGTDFLVAWQDERNGSSNADIYGARVNQAGIVLDSNSIPLSTAPAHERNPAIASDSNNFLVVWQDSRVTGDQEIYGTFVDPLGNVLNPAGIPICTLYLSQYYPAITYDGTNYFVAWVDGNVGGTRISQSGTILDPGGIAISNTVDASDPAVAFDGNNYLVVWDDERNSNWEDLYGARVDQAGNVLDPSGIPISVTPNQQLHADITFDGTNYLVIWEDSRSGDFDVYGTRVTPGGILLDPAGIGIAAGADQQGPASIAFDGVNYFVAWRHGFGSGDIYGGRVNQSGVVLDTNGIPISGGMNAQYHPAIAHKGTDYLVVWQDIRNGDWDIYGARVDSTGSILNPSPIAISIAAHEQIYPTAFSDGTNYLVAWSDRRNGSHYDIYGTRLTASGAVLDPLGIPISNAQNDQVAPDIAFDGTNYMITWHDERTYSNNDIYGARVTQDGSVLDPAGFGISIAAGHQEYPKIAFDGTNYFVVWDDMGEIYGSRVDQTGTVLDPSGIEISVASIWPQDPSIDFDGTNYLVVWTEHGGGAYDIYGARVNQSGLVLDPWPILIDTSVNKQEHPAIAFDGNAYGIVWQDLRSGMSNDIRGCRITTGGTVTDTFAVSTRLGNQIRPSLSVGSTGKMLVTYAGWTDSINAQPANVMRIWGIFGPFVGIFENLIFPVIETKLDLAVSPNPARRGFCVEYIIEKNTYVNISLYDIAGRFIRVLVNEERSAGIHREMIDIKETAQNVYFVVLQTEDHFITEKIVCTR